MQKLRTCFLATILTAACIGSALAQEPTEMNEPPATRREIGFGTNIILGQIFESGSTPLDLMYRWGDDRQLFRLGTSLAYSSTNHHYNQLNDLRTNHTFNTMLFLGREWRRDLVKRWIINFGSDINFNFSGFNRRTESTYDEGQEGIRLSINEEQTLRFGGGLRPFLGVLFKINERLLLGTEASFLASIQKYESSAEISNLLNGEVDDRYTNSDRTDSAWEYNMRTQPASNIFVYYRF